MSVEDSLVLLIQDMNRSFGHIEMVILASVLSGRFCGTIVSLRSFVDLFLLVCYYLAVFSFAISALSHDTKSVDIFCANYSFSDVYSIGDKMLVITCPFRDGNNI